VDRSFGPFHVLFSASLARERSHWLVVFFGSRAGSRGPFSPLLMRCLMSSDTDVSSLAAARFSSAIWFSGKYIWVLVIFSMYIMVYVCQIVFRGHFLEGL
jgi:hypothetical protein